MSDFQTVFFAIISETVNEYACTYKLCENMRNYVQTQGRGEINTA